MTAIGSLGPRIGAARTAAGIDIRAFANAVGTTVEKQEQIESGAREISYAEVLRAAVLLETAPGTWLNQNGVGTNLAARLFDHAIYHAEVLRGLSPLRQWRTPPADGRGSFFIDRGLWTQLAAGLAGDNKNYPFAEQDRDTPFRQFKLVRLCLGTTSIELTFDLDRADGAALRSALRFLEAIPGDLRPVELNFRKHAWFEEIHGDTGSAVARIEQLSAYRGLPLASRTVVRRLHLDGLVGAPPLLRACRETWQNSPTFGALAEAGLADRVILMTLADDGRPAFAKIGRNAAISHYFGSAWRHRALGGPIGSSLPDRSYDRASAQGIFTVLETGEPRYDHVLARIARPGQDRHWAAYHRLLLPSGNQVVSVVELVRPQKIGIPFLRPP